MATIIKHCQNAVEARFLEAKIKNEVEISESLTSKQKTKILSIFNPILSKNTIDASKIKIQDILKISVEENEIYNFDAIYLSETCSLINISDLSEKEPLEISGQMVGMI